MKRFDCLKSLAAMLDPKAIVVTNVGPICREWNALRPSDANLLQVNVGLCAGVGLGIAVSLPHRQVVMLDGDGNLLLNLASLADLANQKLTNVVHIVLDNESYEGGGGLSFQVFLAEQFQNHQQRHDNEQKPVNESHHGRNLPTAQKVWLPGWHRRSSGRR